MSKLLVFQEHINLKAISIILLQLENNFSNFILKNLNFIVICNGSTVVTFKIYLISAHIHLHA